MRRFLRAPGDINALDLSQHEKEIEQIACWASQHEPQLAVKLFIEDWGLRFGRFAPTCLKWKIGEKVPEVASLTKQLNKLNGASTNHCGFSIGRDFIASCNRLEWRAAIDPKINSTEESPHISVDTGYIPPSFTHWSQQGVWENEQYRLTLKLRDSAQLALTNYYLKHLHLAPSAANKTANYYLNKLILAYLDNTPSSPEQRALKYESGILKIEDVRRYLSASTEDRSSFNRDYMEILLKLAVINNFSLSEIEIILEDFAKRATPDRGNPYTKETLLMKATFRPDVLALLLNKGLWNVNAANWAGKTALMYAAQYDKLESVELLLTHGAEVNQQTFAINEIPRDYCFINGLKAGKRTALMYAAWYGSEKLISLLINTAADIKSQDDRGETPAEYLAQNEILSPEARSRVVKMLTSGTKSKP